MDTSLPRLARLNRGAEHMARVSLMLVLLLVTLIIWQRRDTPAAPQINWPAPQSAPNLDRLPLSFVPNAGQFDPRVRFQAHGLGGELFFTPSEVVLSLPVLPSQVDTSPRGAAPFTSASIDWPKSFTGWSAVGHRQLAPTNTSASCQLPVTGSNAYRPRCTSAVRLRFEGANPAVQLSGGTQLPGRASYFRGDSPAHWHTNVPTYAGIRYAALYPGIDLHYDGLSGQLKGTYTIAPGADPERIRWRYEGSVHVQIDEPSGDLLVERPGAPALIEHAPTAWQEINGRRAEVPVRFMIRANGLLGFALGHYDRAYPLIIDPTLSYSTYLGGNGSDTIEALALDSIGNIYLTGSTISSDFPGAPLNQSVRGQGDIFVAKLSADGQTLLYSAILGGDSSEQVSGLALESDGRVLIAGLTDSSDFPTAHAFQTNRADRDGFVARLSPDGARLDFSSYLGGDSMDWGSAVGVDGAGDVYVTGFTASADFLQPLPAQPTGGAGTFVVKLSVDGGTLHYTRILSEGDPQDLAVDAAGSVYITGTASAGFPLVKALQGCRATSGDVFVTKLQPNGAIDFSTCFGGSDRDYSFSIAVDSVGGIYVGGQTASYDFPLINAYDRTRGLYDDAFISKLSSDGQTMLYSTFIGGYGMDTVFDLAVDSHGNAYATGSNQSEDFPLVDPLPMVGDGFVAKLNHQGNMLLFSSRLGGGRDAAGIAIALRANSIYVAGWTQSDAFPTVHPLQPQLQGGQDGFVTKIDIPSTTLTSQLIDDVTSEPIRNQSGTVTLYAGTNFLDSADFHTNGQGAFTVEFSGPISQSVRLEYGGVAGYARQFYDRKRALSQASAVPLHSGLNTLTSRLTPATVLEQTLLDDLTSQPIANAAGSIEVYSGTVVLERTPFTTDANGMALISFDTLIAGPVRLGYVLDQYLKQYHDRKLQLEQAVPITLSSGMNRLTTRLSPETRLINILLDDRTGQPIALVNGSIQVLSGTQQLDSRSFTTDATGVYTTTFRVPINQNVRLRYSVNGYARQYYDRVPTFDQATEVALHAGTNVLTARLRPRVTLVNTLLDDNTGQPIAGVFGSLQVYLGTQSVENTSFVTNQSGVYTVSLQALLGPNVALQYHLPGYARQFYDRKREIDQATRLTIDPGVTRLTTRLTPATTLVNTLLDDVTGERLAGVEGFLSVHLGGARVDLAKIHTNAAGVYTATFQSLLDRPVQLEYSNIAGHARQFYDRRFGLALADSLTLSSGINRLTTRLLPAPQLAVTLLDDATGQPIANATGTLTIYSDTLALEQRAFTTDASGVLTATLTNTFVGQATRLGFQNIAGYARQFYDRRPTLAQADAIVLGSGRTQVAARLIRATTIVNTLLDDASSEPIANTVGTIAIYSGTLFLESAGIRTDATGVFTVPLVSLLNQDVRLGYQITGYPFQFYDRKPAIIQADPVALHTGRNVLTTRLQTTRLLNTLISDATGLPIANTAGTLEIYSGTLRLQVLPFITNAEGRFTANLARLLDQHVQLAYTLPGYPRQFHDGATTLHTATSVRLIVGETALTTRLRSTTLVNTLHDDLTGAPLVGADGTIEIYAGGALLAQQAFRTDASGVYTITLAQLINQPVKIAHSAAGYPRQFYDRKLIQAEADQVRLKTGLNKLIVRMLPQTVVTTTLLDDVTGQPIRNTHGEVRYYAGTIQIGSAFLWTDAAGSFTLPFAQVVSESVRIEYRFTGYADQFADQKMTPELADLIFVRPGLNSLIARLVKVPTLTITLIDDPTGQPIPNISGSLMVYWDRGFDSVSFTTDANGQFTAQFRPSDQAEPTVPFGVPLNLELLRIPGYNDQFYDRAYQKSDATPVILQPGANQLAIRITRPQTVLVATLKDGDSPILHRDVHVAIERTSGPIFEGDYTTDSNGTILMDLGWLIGTDFRFRFQIAGFPTQYFDGTTRFDGATLIPLYSTTNYRTFQIARYPHIINYLVDDTTGAPLANILGYIRVYTDTATFMRFPFDTDDNGGLLLELEGLNVLSDSVRLAYEVNGYPAQFHDHKASYAEANPVVLQNWLTIFTTRLSKQVVPPLGAIGNVTPELGGVLTAPGPTTLTLAFPPGAVTEPVSVTLTRQLPDPPLPGWRAVGSAFNIIAYTASNAAVSTFARPFTLTLHYRDIDGADLDPRSLRIFAWDAALDRWVELPTQANGAGTLVASATSAGRFAVFGQPIVRTYLPIVRR